MSSLLEVVFENVLKTKVIQLLMLLVSTSRRIINIQCSENIELMNEDKLDMNLLSNLLNFDGDISALISLNGMNIGSITLPNVLLRLVKYGDHYDIDFNFDSKEVDNIDMTALVVELHHHAKEIARDHSMAEYFCGMEPASDEDTRYFTNETLGPLANY
ncbi:hypothetical protein [Shewanella surugensis]|uniref:Uncharacterized protein n=1 Tax=Shewanella surugensis TaxID=212020 RepID=A0ABT0LFB3_9GAMM|nr:hypothetical protein [Shewanella surugensis]MCL1126249.1 hypothetical protein [Shewanella surugensis]